MKIKKSICITLIFMLGSVTIGCSNESNKKIDFKSKVIEFVNKKNEEQDKKETIKTIADSININIDEYKIENDYENKPTIVLKITYKNNGKDIKILDSEDITLYQGKYKLKSTYDISLNTEAFYEEIKPNESKTFMLGYRVEGDNNFTLKFNPFLSKESVKLDIEYPKK